MSVVNVSGQAQPIQSSKGYEVEIRDLETKVITKLNEVRTNCMQHLTMLENMATIQDSGLMTKHLFKKDQSRIQDGNMMTLYPNISANTTFLRSKLRDIEVRRKQVQGFLRNYKELDTQTCIQAVEAMTLTDGRENKAKLRQREKEALELYRSLMKERDISQGNPAIVRLKEEFEGKVIQSIDRSKRILTETYSKIVPFCQEKGESSGYFPIDPSWFDYKDIAMDLIQMFSIGDDSYRRCKVILDSFPKIPTEMNTDKMERNTKLFSYIRSHTIQFNVANAVSNVKSLFPNSQYDPQATPDVTWRSIIGGNIGSPEATEYAKALQWYWTTGHRDPTYKDIIPPFVTTKLELKKECQTIISEYLTKKQEVLTREKGKDLPRGAIEAHGSRSRKVFRAYMCNETAKSLFYGVLDPALAEMLFYEFPDETMDKHTARSGQTPLKSRDALKEADNKDVWTPYTKCEGESPDVVRYIQNVMPLFRPAGSYLGLYTGSEFQEVTFKVTDPSLQEIRYPFPQTGTSDTAGIYGYDFKAPSGSFWVNPYSDEDRSHNTVFWHIRLKMELLDAIERFKRTQQDRRPTTAMDRFLTPVAQALHKGGMDVYYNELVKRGYGTPETFVTLKDQALSDIVSQLGLNGHQSFTLQSIVTQFTEDNTTRKETQKETQDKKDEVRSKDKADMVDRGDDESLGKTLRNFLFPEDTPTDNQPGTGSETPGTGSETPGTATETPGTATETPGTATETPGTATETPGTATETPGTATETDQAHIIKVLREELNRKRSKEYSSPIHLHSGTSDPGKDALIRSLTEDQGDRALDQTLAFNQETELEREYQEAKRKELELRLEIKTSRHNQQVIQHQTRSDQRKIAELESKLHQLDTRNTLAKIDSQHRRHVKEQGHLKDAKREIQELKQKLHRKHTDSRRETGPRIFQETQRTPRKKPESRGKSKSKSKGKSKRTPRKKKN